MATNDRKKGKLNPERPAPLLYAMTESLVERLREVEGSPRRSIGHIASLHRITDNDANEVDPPVRSAGLREDNQNLALAIRLSTFPAQV
ncbi:MAG: starvation/stationary phase protection protein [Gammaproteobacteria bacterium]|nr:starvation/stationary phase protection protein [Gammaproteobacteria bacterium]